MNGWAHPALYGDSNLLLSSVEEGLNVGLIATFELRCCDADDDVKDVVINEELREFDYVPVKKGGEIVGLLHRAAQDAKNTKGRVREAMYPLRGDLIISANAGVLSYIEGADERPCRLVLRGSRLDGIVTLSDLQRLPVRPALFLLVTHVELLMTRWIRMSLGSSEEDILPELKSKSRRKSVTEKWERLKRDNLAVDVLSATDFEDKRRLFLRSGFPLDPRGAGAELKTVANLRNSVAHSGDYALSVKNALNTVKAVQLARCWIGRLEDAIERQEAADDIP